ncbi:MAG: hypothetical protein NT031_02195 [Planctomycetota bacterium]|nr:hypothetical protein [Planctomycetota bacterium]
MVDDNELKPALHDRHVEAGAVMGAAAGWVIPMHFAGVAAEVAAVRTGAGVVDISHVGRIRIRGAQALEALERLCTVDVAHQEDLTAARTLLCNEAGGILDDAWLIRLADEWLLTCSPIAREKVLAHVEALTSGMEVKVSDQTSKIFHLAVAGPATLQRLEPVLPEQAAGLERHGVRVGSMLLAKWIALRVGYTGTFGVEVILPNMLAWQAWRFITQKAGANCIAPVGLAARDVLRLEAGLPRYGHELNETIDPFTAGLDHLLDFGHDFLGRSALEALRGRTPSRRPVGLAGPAQGAIPTLGSPIADAAGREVGAVTSGTFSPTLDRLIALAYVTADTAPDADVTVQTPTGPVAMKVTTLPFVP